MGFLNQPKNVVIEANANFYDEPTIWKEKLRFYDSIGKKANQRRQTEKSDPKLKNIEDIFTEIETRDASGAFLPTFVALRLHNVPLTPDGAVSNAQILGNLKALHRDLTRSVKPPCVNSSVDFRVTPTILHPGGALQSPRTPGRRILPKPIDLALVPSRATMEHSPASTIAPASSATTSLEIFTLSSLTYT